MSDVLYTAEGLCTRPALLYTLRRLLAAGGCRYVLHAWYDRQAIEASFLDDVRGDLPGSCTVHRLWTKGEDLLGQRCAIDLLEIATGVATSL